MSLELSILSQTCAISHLSPGSPFPAWAQGSQFLAITRTADELSIVCEARFVPEGVKTERGWRVLKVAGPLDFSLVGILANLAVTLAEAGVSIFAVSTFDTDYILVKENQLERAVGALCRAGHSLCEESGD